MMWARRIGFFLMLNIVVVLTISFIGNLLGVTGYMHNRGGAGASLDYGSLMTICFLWGMGGAFISLLFSKLAAKWMMGVKIIDPKTPDANQRELVNIVHQLARAAGLKKMPEVGIYESPEVNAFATGPTRNNSLVAVSTGLLGSMDRAAVEGVLGHEVTHIANGDMVTMTLIQGIVNAFVMALARIVAFAIDNFLRDRNNRGGGLGQLGYFFTVMALEVLFFIPGSMIVAWYSRGREYRADAGGAKLAGRDHMIGALRNLQRMQAINMSPEVRSAPAFASLKISASRGRMVNLFSTHPALEDRIARLERGV